MLPIGIFAIRGASGAIIMENTETERDIIFDLLSQEVEELPSSPFQYDVLPLFKELELSDASLSTLVYGTSSDMTMSNRLEELRDMCRGKKARLEDLTEEKERLAQELLSRIMNRRSLLEHEGEVKYEQTVPFFLRDAPTENQGIKKMDATEAKMKTKEDSSTNILDQKFNSGLGVAPYERDVWERVTGNYKDDKEIPVDVEHLLLMFADKRRAKDQKGDPNAILDTSGSPLAITFKPRYWKQFEKTKGSAHMKNLRKDAVRDRHQSTLVVDTHMTSTEDRALSFEAATQIKPV